MAAAERFDQRPRFDDFDNFVYLVARGADPDRQRAGRGPLLLDRSLHRHRPPGALPAHRRGARTPDASPSRHRTRSPQIVIVYFCHERAGRQLLPVLSDFDDHIDSLEDDILKAPTEAQLGELFDMKRTLMNDAQGHGAPARHDGQHQRRASPTCPGMTDEAGRGTSATSTTT